MSRKAVQAWRAVWTTPEGESLASKVAECLRQGGRDLRSLPLAETNGRVDLRGIVLEGLKVDAGPVECRDLDFSGANLSHARLHHAAFVNCVFDSADLRGWAQWDTSFRSCTFIDTDCSDASFGADGGDVLECRFVRTKFTRTTFIRPAFQTCTFDTCKLKGVDFNLSAFDDCRFRGVLADVRFNGYFEDAIRSRQFGPAARNLMRNVDFSEARFEYVSFDNHCDLSTVIPPKDGMHVLVYRFRECIDEVERQIAQSSDDTLKKGAAIWIPLLRGFARQQESYIVSQFDFRPEGAAFAATFFELFAKCEAQAP